MYKKYKRKIKLYEDLKKRKFKTVNLTVQMILLFIPLVNLWAWYRIKKIWYGIVLNILSPLILFGFFIIEIIITLENPNEVISGIIILTGLISQYIPNLYFMYRWSKKWNKIQEENKIV